MAFQKGIIKLKGSIGDLSFYKTRNNGYQAREKGGIDAARIATDPQFQRTRENNAEFGRAVKASKTFRTVFRSLVIKGADSSFSNRLTKLMVQVVKMDAVHDRGERMVLDAETELLHALEFNVNGLLSSTVQIPYSGSIDRTTGKLTVSLPEFVPRVGILAPDGTTHFKFKAAGAMIDFETESSELTTKESDMIAYDNTPVQPDVLECQLAPQLSKPLFLAFGIDFYQKVNGKDYPLNNGTRNGLCIIQVSGV